MVYTRDPSDPSKTLFRHELLAESESFMGLGSKIESAVVGTFSGNASKGLEILESICDRIVQEAAKIKEEASTIISKVETEASTIIHKVEAEASTIIHKVEAEASSIISKVESEASTIIHKVEAEASTIIHKVETEAKKITEEAKGVIGKVEHTAKTALESRLPLALAAEVKKPAPVLPCKEKEEDRYRCPSPGPEDYH